MQLFTSVWRTSALEARHHSSGYARMSDGYRLAFPDYIRHTRDFLLSAHQASGAASPKEIVNGNAPFELKPLAGYPAGTNKIYRRGVLLTHGLSDSPYFMRHLGAFFQESGFRVMAILLPGHGTQPGDLLDVSWQEWVEAVAYGLGKLEEEVDEVYLAGFSAGGTLSAYQTLRDNRVRGLFLFSPALKIAPRAVLAQLHKLYSWLLPKGKWLDLKPDHDIYKYESFPKNAVAQIYALTKKVNKLLIKCKPDIPVFVAASADDATVDISATIEFVAQASHPASRMVLYATDTTMIPPGIPPEKIEMVNSVFPEKRILSSAHTAIVLPAGDAYYGEQGEYSNCAHYYPDDIVKYTACNKSPAEDFQGELTEANLKIGILRRLMYNPNYSALQVSMKRFIEDLP